MLILVKPDGDALRVRMLRDIRQRLLADHIKHVDMLRRQAVDILNLRSEFRRDERIRIKIVGQPAHALDQVLVRQPRRFQVHDIRTDIANRRVQRLDRVLNPFARRLRIVFDRDPDMLKR